MNKINKGIIGTIAAAGIAVSLAACSSPADTSANEQQPEVHSVAPKSTIDAPAYFPEWAWPVMQEVAADYGYSDSEAYDVAEGAVYAWDSIDVAPICDVLYYEGEESVWNLFEVTAPADLPEGEVALFVTAATSLAMENC